MLNLATHTNYTNNSSHVVLKLPLLQLSLALYVLVRLQRHSLIGRELWYSMVFHGGFDEDQLDLEGSGKRLDCRWQPLATGQLPCSTLHLAMQWSFNISNVNCRRNTRCTRVLISLSTHNAHCGGFATGTGQLSTSSATAALPPAPTCAFQPLWCARGFHIFNISNAFNTFNISNIFSISKALNV